MPDLTHCPKLRIIGIADGVNIYGTNDGDNYLVSDISALTEQYTINEKGGEDTITIDGVTSTKNFRFFFDVNTSGSLGNDLYIFETEGTDAGDPDTEMYRFIRQGKFKEDEGENYREANGICIKNYNSLAGSNVEHFIFGSKEIGVPAYISAIKESVASWLNSYNTENGTDYATAMEAIQDGAGTNSLFNAYTSNAQTACDNNLYNVG